MNFRINESNFVYKFVGKLLFYNYSFISLTVFLPSINITGVRIAFFALSANYRVDIVSEKFSTDGDTHTMNITDATFYELTSESFSSLVSFESLKGICFLILVPGTPLSDYMQ